MSANDIPQKKNQDCSAEESMESSNVFTAVGNVSDQLNAIEKFISRRFDEISMEINATSQQLDISENGITRRFTEILEVLHAISLKGDGKTPANKGVELDAVVEMTEAAANRILDAADRIAERIHKDKEWNNDKTHQNTVKAIDKDIEEIFMACEFQDITGQRIRNTLENLKTIEDQLGRALNKMGIDLPMDDTTPTMIEKASSQKDVDNIFDEE